MMLIKDQVLQFDCNHTFFEYQMIGQEAGRGMQEASNFFPHALRVKR
jgi:hypothetical protein